MITSELSRVEKHIEIRATRQRVWHALTNLQEFARWFRVEASGVFEPGVCVEMVSTHPLGGGAKFSVTVHTMDPERLFSWHWHPWRKLGSADNETEPEPDSLVEFRLEDIEGGTRVTVVESGFDGLSLARRAEAFKANEKGWEIQLAALNEYAGKPA